MNFFYSKDEQRKTRPVMLSTIAAAAAIIFIAISFGATINPLGSAFAAPALTLTPSCGTSDAFTIQGSGFTADANGKEPGVLSVNRVFQGSSFTWWFSANQGYLPGYLLFDSSGSFSATFPQDFNSNADGSGTQAQSVSLGTTGPGTDTVNINTLNGESASATFTVPCPPDTTPPTVSITSPQDGSYVNTAQFQVKGTASDNSGGSGVKSVTVQIDGGSPNTATPNAPGDWSTWSVMTQSLSDGQHTIQAIAIDNTGNQATSSSVKVFVDTNPPDTKITSAMDGKGNTIPKSGNTHSSKITFSFTGSDNFGGSGVAGFQCSLDSSNSFTTCTSPQSYSGLTAGTHTSYVRSVDKAGNVDPTPATFKWRINGPVS